MSICDITYCNSVYLSTLIEVSKELTEAIDGSCKISFKALSEGLDDDESFGFLKKKFPKELNFLTGLEIDDKNKIFHYCKDLNDIHEPQSFNINDNGLSLLLTYVLNMMADNTDGIKFTI